MYYTSKVFIGFQCFNIVFRPIYMWHTYVLLSFKQISSRFQQFSMENCSNPLWGKVKVSTGFLGRFHLKPVWNPAKKPAETLTTYPPQGIKWFILVDHQSRVSSTGKLFSSNPFFYLLILLIVCPEPSSSSHLSKPYDHHSPAPSPSSSSSIFMHLIMPMPVLA